MNVSELIADLTTLQPPACDPASAIALVTAGSKAEMKKTSEPNGSRTDREDPDLKRAEDLLELHANVKLAHQDGYDKGLEDARAAVRNVMEKL